MNIKTAPHESGQKIVAKGGGKQRTVAIDSNKSSSWNHGNAAGTLALALGLEWSDEVSHFDSQIGFHTFVFPG